MAEYMDNMEEAFNDGIDMVKDGIENAGESIEDVVHNIADGIQNMGGGHSTATNNQVKQLNFFFWLLKI